MGYWLWAVGDGNAAKLLILPINYKSVECRV